MLYGTEAKIEFVYDDGLRTYKTTKPFEGVIGNLERRYRETESAGMREEIEKYMSTAPCDSCSVPTSMSVLRLTSPSQTSRSARTDLPAH